MPRVPHAATTAGTAHGQDVRHLRGGSGAESPRDRASIGGCGENPLQHRAQHVQDHGELRERVRASEQVLGDLYGPVRAQQNLHGDLHGPARAQHLHGDLHGQARAQQALGALYGRDRAAHMHGDLPGQDRAFCSGVPAWDYIQTILKTSATFQVMVWGEVDSEREHGRVAHQCPGQNKRAAP